MIFTADDIQEYILNKEKDKPNPTIFLIREVTCGETNKIQDEAVYRDPENRVRVYNGKSNKIIISACLVGWKNLKNKKGEDIPFSIENIFKLPPIVQTELRNEIDRISVPKDDDIKN